MSLSAHKVLFFSHNLNVDEGAPTSLMELCRGLSLRKSITPIVMSPKSASLKTYYEKEGYTVITDPIYELPVLTNREEVINNCILLIGHVMKKLGVQALVANTFLSYHAVNAAITKNIPNIWIIRESINPLDQFTKLLTKNSRAAFNYSIQNTDHLVFVSKTTRNLWVENLSINTDRVSVIHNGLYTSRFSVVDSMSKRQARFVLGLDANKTVLLNVGTICIRKNQQQILDALLLLPDKFLELISMVFVGDQKENYANEFKQKLENSPRLQKAVKLFEPTPEIEKFYKAADAFVFTSLSESYPRVILEALFFSLPVITAEVFGVKEQTRDGESALYYKQDKIETLAARILQILNPKTRRILSVGAKRQYRKLTDYDGMVGQYGKLLKNLLHMR